MAYDGLRHPPRQDYARHNSEIYQPDLNHLHNSHSLKADLITNSIAEWLRSRHRRGFAELILYGAYEPERGI